ncbi:phosphatidylinositol-4-phosphate 5-kinase, putative [Plasmodium ovale]|uniref:Phosphatidylinositol-4-phosphate 5-kinase, putative n=2 Tax=Plasmodium ovale TaxID=36330 RepID=A0A1A8WJI5_PLAOA|nr:phosphatidylinositol-4-phosphate 5-kinase, putative [Plasmodium ovale curtisi]SCP04624.1 phosphatidylinositol-4-phosphate 5-kinase, putative [Plasmodium ovale]
MGNKCSCAEISNDKQKKFHKEDYTKLSELHEDFEGKEIHEESEYDEGDYFYRFQGRNYVNKLGTKGEELPIHVEEKRDSNWGYNHCKGGYEEYDLGNTQLEGKNEECLINVRRILMCIREHEGDFLTFFKERNATNLLFLKYIIMNYETYMMYIDTGVIYIGEVNEINEKNGLGVVITPDQCIYIGELEKDKITGFGLYVHFSKSKYIGYWKKGKANGYGVFIHPDGTFYKGLWLNDRQNQKGIEYVNNTYIFLGNYEKGKKNNFGAFLWSNKSMYIGNIKRNNFFKNGLYFFSKKKIYIGKWKDNCIYGICEIVWIDKRQYVGYHRNNIKEGLGLYKWNDGRIYFGSWYNNKQHGHGIFIIIKHVKDYETYINNPFFFFFKNTQKIKKYFVKNISKESFFDKGKISHILEKILIKWDHLSFYNFILILLHISYYKICATYFNLLKKKRLNNFKFNYKFYEKVKLHFCNTTNDYLVQCSSNNYDNLGKDNIYFSVNSDINNCDVRENIPFRSTTREESTNWNDEQKKPFEDIELLRRYINSVNLSYMSEEDINEKNPLFSYASNNIILKYGIWNNGKLIKWIYSSDNDISGITNVDGKTNEYTEFLSNKKKTKLGPSSNLKGHVIEQFLSNISSSAVSSICRKGRRRKKRGRKKGGIKLKGGAIESEKSLSEESLSKESLSEESLSEESLSEKSLSGESDEEVPISYSKNKDSEMPVCEKDVMRDGRSIQLGYKSARRKKERRIKKGLLLNFSDSTSDTVSTKNDSSIPVMSENTSNKNSSIGEEKKEVTNCNKIEAKSKRKNTNAHIKDDYDFYEDVFKKDKIGVTKKLVNDILDENSDMENVDEYDECNGVKCDIYREHKGQKKNRGNRFDRIRINGDYSTGADGIKNGHETDPYVETAHGEMPKGDTYGGDKRHQNGSHSVNRVHDISSISGVHSSRRGRGKDDLLPIISQNYDLPKKGFSLIWSLKKLKNSNISANEPITFEAFENCSYDKNGSLTQDKKKKTSFFRNFLRANKGNRKKE